MAEELEAGGEKLTSLGTFPFIPIVIGS